MPVVHTKSTAGTQARGLAIGSLYVWTPDINTTLTIDGALVTLASVEVTDCLSLSVYLENAVGAVGSINAFTVDVSDDNTNWTTIFTQTLTSAIVAGSKRLVCEITGWKNRYVRVRAKTTNGASTASAKCSITGSIFSSSQTLVTASEFDAFQRSFSRKTVWETQTPVNSTFPPAGSTGSSVDTVDYAFVQVVPSTACDFWVVAQCSDGTWVYVDGTFRSNVTTPYVQRLKVSNFSKVAVVLVSGTVTSVKWGLVT